MFVLSKVFFSFAAPANIFVVLLASGCILLWLRSERSHRFGRLILTLAALAAVAIALMPVADDLVAPLEDRFPRPARLPEHIDGIIVLGGSTQGLITAARDQVTLTPQAARLTEALALARRHPEARILFTGGSGSLSPGALSEADIAKRFFADLGLDRSRLELEDRSRNTYENVLLSKKLAAPKPKEQWLLLTSAVHMPRAVGIFRAQGWDVIPYPVDYRTIGDGRAANRFDFAAALASLNYAAKEWFGLFAYRLLGRTNAVFPGPE